MLGIFFTLHSSPQSCRFAPEYLQLMFKKLSDNSSRSLRNTDMDLRIPRFATSYGQRSF